MPTDDPRYFGYTTRQNTELTELWQLGNRMGEDLRHYPPPAGNDQAIEWTRDPESVDINDGAGRAWSNNNTVEAIYSRIMAQNAGDVERLGLQWYSVEAAIDNLATRILTAANGLRYGGNGSPGGTGWTGAGADAFLARGPGATIKSLDDWREAASANGWGALRLSGSIRTYQQRMQNLYDDYKEAMVSAHNRWFDRYGLEGEPRTVASLAAYPSDFRAMYIDALREEELIYRWRAQQLQYEMGQQYWTVLREMDPGRATVYEGPRDAVRENFDFVARTLASSQPGLLPPAGGAPPVPPPLPLPTVPPAPNPVNPGPTPGLPGSPPGPAPVVPPAPGPVAPPVPAPVAPLTPAPPVPVAPPAPAPPVAPALPGGGRAPLAPGAPGLPPGGGLPPGAGGRPTVPGVLRGLAGAPPDSPPPGTFRPPGTPGVPLSRTSQGPEGTPPGTPQAVGPVPEAFIDSTNTTPPPPVLRAPQVTGMPPDPPVSSRPTTPRPGAAAPNAGGPPSGVAPPVLNRARPARPDRQRRRRPPQPGYGSMTDFAPPTVPGGPVLGRTPPPAEAPNPGRVPGPGAAPGVVRGRRPSDDAGELGVRKEMAPAARAKIDEEYEQIRAVLISGEAAWEVKTPGGGVVTSPPPRSLDAASEPKPHLRGGAA